MLSVSTRTLVLCVIAVVVAVLGALTLNRPAEQEYEGKVLKAWVTELNAADAKVREQAEEFFGRIGTSAVPELMTILGTPEPRARRTFWSALAYSPILRWGMPRQLRPPDTVSVRSGAAVALGLLGSKSKAAIPALRKALCDQPSVATSAARALSRIGSDSVPVLVEAMHDDNAEVRRLAVFVLGEIGPSAGAAVPAILEVMLQGDTELQRSALHSLSRIGIPGLAQLHDAVAQRVLPASEAAAAAMTVYQAAMLGSLPDLVKIASDAGFSHQQDAVRVLGMVRAAGQRVEESLISASMDPSSQVRRSAAAALNTPGPLLGDQVSALARLVADPASEVRLAAIQSLAQIGPRAQEALPALKSWREQCRVAAESDAIVMAIFQIENRFGAAKAKE